MPMMPRAHYSFMHHVLVLQEDRKPLPNGDMPVTIKVIGVGGAGGNAINGMVSTTKNLQGVEFIAMVSTVHVFFEREHAPRKYCTNVFDAVASNV
jgi:hypothetical protein